VAGDVQNYKRGEGFRIFVVFLLMLLLNVVVFASAYVIVFKPFEGGKSKTDSAYGPVYKLEQFIVDVGNVEMRKGCRAEIALELKDNKALIEVQKREAEIRSKIIDVLRLNTIELLKKNNETTDLRELITEELNGILGEGKVKTTWFTDFIVD
jgi:flagellar basal body-associated protein FliL